MAFINSLKNKLFPAKVSNPERNRDLGNGAVVFPNQSADQIRQALLKANTTAAKLQNHVPKNDVALTQKATRSR